MALPVSRSQILYWPCTCDGGKLSSCLMHPEWGGKTLPTPKKGTGGAPVAHLIAFSFTG